MTARDADKERGRILDELQTGRLRLESITDREVAGMFLGLNESIELLMRRCDFTLVGVPSGTGPRPARGFIGSATVETAIPVREDAALVITPAPAVRAD